MRADKRALPLALLLAAGLAASPASAAPEWKQASLSAGYRLTAGSSDYIGHAGLVRGRLRLTPLWSGYTKLDLVTDRVYDDAVSWIVGAERDLPHDWLAWGGLGFEAARFKDDTSASSFRLETGAGRELGRWWCDAEYWLLSGKAGQVLPGGQASSRPSSAQASASMTAQQMGGGMSGGGDPHGGGSAPVLSAPSEAGGSFTQNEATLFVGSPAFDWGKPVYLGFSGSYWTRTGGPDGVTPFAGLSVKLTKRWATTCGVWTDIPSSGSSRYYGSVGLRYALLPR